MYRLLSNNLFIHFIIISLQIFISKNSSSYLSCLLATIKQQYKIASIKATKIINNRITNLISLYLLSTQLSAMQVCLYPISPAHVGITAKPLKRLRHIAMQHDLLYCLFENREPLMSTLIVYYPSATFSFRLTLTRSTFISRYFSTPRKSV